MALSKKDLYSITTIDLITILTRRNNMATWYVNELSKLTGVSVQTLHYYDKIALLQPSNRLQNGYRVYSKDDLLILQKITALKFFGFSLSHIKSIVQNRQPLVSHLKAQLTALTQQKQHIESAIKTIKHAIKLSEKESLPWKQIIELIEVYKMTDKIEKTWLKDVFSKKEIVEYSEFLRQLNNNETNNKKHKQFQTEWAKLTDEIAQNLNTNPKSELGINIGKRCLEILNTHYGQKYAHLRTAKLEKGFGAGKGLEENNLNPKVLTWLEAALDAYLRNRIYSFLNNPENLTSPDAKGNWNSILDDMYGEDEKRKKELLQKALLDANINKTAKNWLNKQ